MSAMMIQCILRPRKGGTKVTLGGTEYHFVPDNEGRHVASVTDPDHIAHFLSIREGYAILGSKAADKVQDEDLGVETAETPEAPTSEPSKEPQENADKALADMTLDELRDVFKREIGREAGPRSKSETLIAQIEAMREEKAQAA